MEIGENVDNQKNPAATAAKISSSLHTTQSQPILLDCESNQTPEKDASARQASKTSNRRVSFASSSQLTQYLEPINPFESFGEWCARASEKFGTFALAMHR
jgi:hypothetical protein